MITGVPERNTAPVVDPSTGTHWPRTSSAYRPTAVGNYQDVNFVDGQIELVGNEDDGLFCLGQFTGADGDQLQPGVQVRQPTAVPW